jgi:hypothetical protein
LRSFSVLFAFFFRSFSILFEGGKKGVTSEHRFRNVEISAGGQGRIAWRAKKD